jgi:hypothetical protein
MTDPREQAEREVLEGNDWIAEQERAWDETGEDSW